MKGLIYCVHCISTGKKYIGQTVQKLQYRINHHFTCKRPSHFHRAIRKYGRSNFICGVVEECDFDCLNEREMYWIQYFNTFENGYNSDSGGMNGRLLSEETKLILKEKNLGQNNARWGIKLDEELKQKIRQSNSKYKYEILEITSGNIHTTNSLRNFCNTHQLKRSNLTRTYTGKYKQHKGFCIVSRVTL